MTEQKPVPEFQCAECGAPVAAFSGVYVRECSHDTAPIVANMQAVAYGQSKVQ